MSNTPETTDDVLVAIRRYADIVELGPPPIGKAFADLFREYADRFEAAAKQEAIDAELKWTRIGYDERKAEGKRSPVNAAVMREALENARSKFIHIKKCADEGEVSRKKLAILCEFVSQEITAALAAPARNCDKYGIDDIKEMDADFGAFCQKFGSKNGENCSGCPIKSMDNLCCHSAWMLLPEKGGAE